MQISIHKKYLKMHSSAFCYGFISSSGFYSVMRQVFTKLSSCTDINCIDLPIVASLWMYIYFIPVLLLVLSCQIYFLTN